MNSDDIDIRIRQALSKADADILEEFSSEQSLFDQGIQLITGRNRLINVLVVMMTFVFLGTAIICLWQFIVAVETKALIGWALGLGISLAGVSMFKLWAWMEIEKNSTIREIKRLELQVAFLSKKLERDV